MKIGIVEIASAEVVHVTPIVLDGVNYEVAPEQYEDEAWKVACNEGAVHEGERERYEFTMVKE